MNKNTKTLLTAIFLVAYLAVLLKFMVSTHHVPSGMGPPGGGVADGMLKIVHSNYVPFTTILPYLHGYPGWPGWSVAIGNLLGNIIPFVPLGFLLPLLYRPISWQGVLGIAVAYSLCIETLQRLLRVGAFDVDDILLNTLGVTTPHGLKNGLKTGGF